MKVWIVRGNAPDLLRSQAQNARWRRACDLAYLTQSCLSLSSPIRYLLEFCFFLCKTIIGWNLPPIILDNDAALFEARRTVRDFKCRCKGILIPQWGFWGSHRRTVIQYQKTVMIVNRYKTLPHTNSTAIFNMAVILSLPISQLCNL